MKMKLRIKEASEKEIENSILTWLSYQPGILAFKVETQGSWDTHKRRFRKAGRWVIRGTADILACLSIQKPTLPPIPVFCAFEVKSRLGRQSPEQRLFENRVKAVSGFYYVVRSIDDVQLALVEVRKRFTF